MKGPILFQWDGEAMVPLKRHAKACDAEFAIGGIYPLVTHESRSRVSHDHYFAAIHEAWLNLPENVAEQFPTEEHLRKKSLIKAGYCDETSIVAASKAEALRIAAFIRPIDDFAIVVVQGATITRFTAKSQSLKAMGKKVFQESKQAVLDVIADLIGVEPEALSSRAEAA